MTLRTYLWGMAVSTILCFMSWMLIVVYIDPTTTNLIGIALFYLSLFFSLIGLFTLVGFFLRRKLFKNETEFAQTGIAFRQGVLLSLVFIGSLMLQNLRMLTLGNVVLLIFGLSLLEFYFLSKK
jgi:hypothetical protein